MSRVRTYLDARQRDTFLGLDVGPRTMCEHCDGERSPMTREDRLRGFVCDLCDSSLDEMFRDRSRP